MKNIAELLRLTEEMLEASRSTDWDLLTTLQQQREQLFQSGLSPAEMPTEPTPMLSTLRKVLLLNHEITSIARDERGHRQAQLEGLHRSRRAASCYEKLS